MSERCLKLWKWLQVLKLHDWNCGVSLACCNRELCPSRRCPLLWRSCKATPHFTGQAPFLKNHLPAWIILVTNCNYWAVGGSHVIAETRRDGPHGWNAAMDTWIHGCVLLRTGQRGGGGLARSLPRYRRVSGEFMVRTKGWCGDSAVGIWGRPRGSSRSQAPVPLPGSKHRAPLWRGSRARHTHSGKPLQVSQGSFVPAVPEEPRSKALLLSL